MGSKHSYWWTCAKGLLSVTKTEFGKKLYGKTLTKNIAEAIFKEKDQLEETARMMIKDLKVAKELKWGFKVLDPNDMRGSVMPKDVMEIPPMEELRGPLDDAKDKFNEINPFKKK